jgi:hypothetical protein
LKTDSQRSMRRGKDCPRKQPQRRAPPPPRNPANRNKTLVPSEMRCKTAHPSRETCTGTRRGVSLLPPSPPPSGTVRPSQNRFLAASSPNSWRGSCTLFRPLPPLSRPVALSPLTFFFCFCVPNMSGQSVPSSRSSETDYFAAAVLRSRRLFGHRASVRKARRGRA